MQTETQVAETVAVVVLTVGVNDDNVVVARTTVLELTKDDIASDVHTEVTDKLAEQLGLENAAHYYCEDDGVTALQEAVDYWQRLRDMISASGKPVFMHPSYQANSGQD